MGEMRQSSSNCLLHAVPSGGDGAAERLVEGDDVHVALGDDHLGAGAGGFAGEVLGVEGSPFRKYFCFRAVQVFRLAVAEHAAAEADGAAAAVADGEHH